MNRTFFIVVLSLIYFSGISRINAQQFEPLDQYPHDIVYLRQSKLSNPKIKVTYGRPSTEVPTIFGNLVAYDEVWRTGANEATESKFYESVYLGDVFIKAGTYSLFTVPNKDCWQILLNKQTDQLGAHFYDPEHTIATIHVQPKKGDYMTHFSIAFKTIEANRYNLVLAWGTQRIPIPLHFKEKTMALRYTSIE